MKEEMTGKLKEMRNSILGRFGDEPVDPKGMALLEDDESWFGSDVEVLEDDFVVKRNLPEEGDKDEDYNRSVVEEYESLASKLDDALKIHKAITIELNENHRAPAELLSGEHGPEDEEAECRRGFDAATEVYMAFFDSSKSPEEVALREAHEDAIQKAMAEFNSSAVGAGFVRQKYEKLLQSFFRKAFEDYKRNAYMEAELQNANAIQNMEKKIRAACHASDASFDHVIKVLDGLVLEYEASCHGPGKWRKLSIFIRIGLLSKQLEASEKQKSEYVKRYENGINDMKKLSNEYTSWINNLQNKFNSLEGKYSSLLKTVDSAKLESSEWKRKHELVLSNHKHFEEQDGAEIAMLKSRYTAADARLDAARKQAKSAQEEVEEWKRRLNLAAIETNAALEKAAVVHEMSNKNMQEVSGLNIQINELRLQVDASNKTAQVEDDGDDQVNVAEQESPSVTDASTMCIEEENQMQKFCDEAETLKNSAAMQPKMESVVDEEVEAL
ncbi:hypothetical protein Drorol1_Dr00026814, partial [Drosera rotundifolia]